MSSEQTDGTVTEQSRLWDAAYARSGAAGVSWHQDTPAVSLSLVDALGVASDTPVIDVGGGASVLVDRLVERGFTDLSVLDTSLVALEQVQARLATEAQVSLLHEDVLRWRPARRFGLWHDRAVLQLPRRLRRPRPVSRDDERGAPARGACDRRDVRRRRA